MNEPFTPVPSKLIDTLVRQPITGGQWRILLWVLRNSLGWQRDSTSFTWYRIAKDIGMNRSAVIRASRALVSNGFVMVGQGQIRVQGDRCLEATLPTGTGAWAQRIRCKEATLFRRAKERSKDIYKKDTNFHPAGAAKPMPGKYEAISRG